MYFFRADGNSKIGMGHIIRCSSIAGYLRDAGKEVCFLISADSDFSRIHALGVPTYQLAQPDSHGWSAAEAAQIMRDMGAEAIILDSYRVTPDDFSQLKTVAPLCYIDDLWAFDYDADIIVNYNIEAEKEFYFPTRYPNRRLYLGPAFFPLRKEMCPCASDRRNDSVKNILLTSGSTDELHIIKDLLYWLEPSRHSELSFQVLLGAFYDTDYAAELKALFSCHSNVSFLPWGQDMKTLYLNTDLMISPGSTMLYEALILGVSCISYCFVENHLTQCKAMAEKGLAPYIGDFRREPRTELAMRAKELFESALTAAHTAAPAVSQFHLDGMGARRIAGLLSSINDI